MSNGEDWLLRPVIAGMCQYESLKTGLLDLADIAKMNYALDVKYANDGIIQRELNRG